MLQVHHTQWAQDTVFQMEVKIMAEKKEIMGAIEELQRL